MTTTGTALDPRATVDASAAENRARHERAMLAVVWGLLVASCLPWRGVQSPIEVSQTAEEAGTAVVVGLAFVLALTTTYPVRWLLIAAFVLVALLVVAALIPWIYGIAEIGSLQRAVRLGAVLATVWVLAPVARADGGAAMVRTHLGVFACLAAVFLLEAILVPALAFEPALGRLQGVLPPLPPPRTGEIGAVTAGLAAIAGVYRLISTRLAVLVFGIGVAVLIASHTRTALIGLAVSLFVGFAAAVGRSPRARLALLAMAAAVALAWLVSSASLTAWFAREQTADELASLTGRRDVWELVLEQQRSGMDLWFGAGLADKSLNGRPIDNGWLAAYVEQGLVGVAIVASLAVAVAGAIVRCRSSAARASAAFLLSFAVVSSISETGISDASTYLLGILAAAVIVAGWRPTADRGRA